LVRSFYLHFGRAEDIHNRYFHQLKKLSWIDKAVKAECRRKVYDSFAPLLKLRNVANHGDLPLCGEHHVDVNMAALAEAAGCVLHVKATGATITLSDALRSGGTRQISVFIDVGRELVRLAQGLLDNHLEMLDELAPGP
jgi:hypothetical protein